MEVQAPQHCTEEASSCVGEGSPGSLVSIFRHHSGRGLGSLLKPHKGGNLDSPISLPGVGILTVFCGGWLELLSKGFLSCWAAPFIGLFSLFSLAFPGSMSGIYKVKEKKTQEIHTLLPLGF